MTKKQMNKIADEIAKWELIHRNPESSQEQIREAENNIIRMSNYVAALPNGMDIMMEIDNLLQKKLEKN
jgi:hypothetical protein